jgi:hypothetical protein
MRNGAGAFKRTGNVGTASDFAGKIFQLFCKCCIWGDARGEAVAVGVVARAPFAGTQSGAGTLACVALVGGDLLSLATVSPPLPSCWMHP